MPVKREDAMMPDDSNTSASSLFPTFRPPAHGFTATIQAISSTLFKLFVYIFLRWIPTSAAYPAIPALFLIYALISILHDLRIKSSWQKFLRHVSSHDANLDQQTSSTKLEAKQTYESAQETLSKGAIEGSSTTPTYAQVVAQGKPISKDQANGRSGRVKSQPKAGSPSIAEWMNAIFFGVSTRSRRFNSYIFAAHSLLFLVFLDSFLSPYLFPSHWDYNLEFARVGAIGPTSAKVHVRYPHPLPPFDGLLEDMSDELGLSGVLRDGSEENPEPVRVIWRRVAESGETAFTSEDFGEREASMSRRWERGPLLRLTEERDWTATAELDNLWPSTRYEWRLAFVHNNTFTPMPERPQQFTTWPDPRLNQQSYSRAELDTELEDENRDRSPLDDPRHFTFASTSCVKPDFPYHPAQFWGWNWLLKSFGIGDGIGGIAQRNRIPGFDLLADRAVSGRSKPSLRFLLQLGDLIYADVPRYGGANEAAYRKLYRNLFASDSFRRVYEKIPVIGIYDDHEVLNNWGGEQVDGEFLKNFPSANTAWQEYVGAPNPEPLERGENYFTFRYGDSAAFFVMDVRKHRTHYESEDGPEKTMLGQRQKDDLLRWLGAVNSTATFKFVVSSVPFNSLWGLDGQKDSWAGYMSERSSLMDTMQYVPNLIVLSGDRHEFAAVSIRDTVTEFSTSPLSMFYLPIRTFSEDNGAGVTGEDKIYKYIPDGNHKWSEFEVDTRDPYRPVVRVSVQVDGKEAWKVEVKGKPVKKPESAVGSIAKTLFELLGLKPRKWF
ncbi:hypothetical protein IE53DRAFT_97589 [Violaceomyces palustris]|uniref:Uncharacterized protein n=1 Tax=Violaceomyces palustris TaxID=1673888 RepID=A0ACD0NX44_9BASI|nr:hypothetical protein IE53DRAFT_97589 [Violaceomyces palustris]